MRGRFGLAVRVKRNNDVLTSKCSHSGVIVSHHKIATSINAALLYVWGRVVVWCVLIAQTQHNQVKHYPMNISETPCTQHNQDILLLSKDESWTWVECSCEILIFPVEDRWKMQATHMKSCYLHQFAQKYCIDCWKIEFLCFQDYGNARN